METLMQKRLKEKQDAYDAQWDNGNGSHHPDYDPAAVGPNVVKASCSQPLWACIQLCLKPRP
jgi:hypothetical protein